MATKRKQYARWSREAVNGVGTVEFTDSTRMQMRLADLPEAIVANALWYGVKQKCADSGSDADSVVDFKAAVRQTWDALCAGTWAQQAGRGPMFSNEDVIEAVVRVNEEKGTPKPRALVAQILNTDERIAIAKSDAAVVKMLHRIRGERLAAKTATTAETLEELFEAAE